MPNDNDQTENIENIATSFDKMDDKMFFMKSLLTKIQFPPNIKLEFENIHIAIAKNGGYLAFCKKHNAFIMDNRNLIKDNVIIMSQDTSKIIFIPFKIERDKIIVVFDFNEDEKLFCILNDGTIFKFDLTLKKPIEIPTGKTFRTEKIETAKLFEKGFTALTKDGNFYLIKNIKEPIPLLFFPMTSLLNIKGKVDYIFLPNSVTKSGKIELIILHPKNGIIIITERPSDKENFEVSNPLNMTINGVFYIKNDKMEQYNNTCGTDEIDSNDLGKITGITCSPSFNQIALYRSSDNSVFFFHSTFDQNLEKYKRMTTKFNIDTNINVYTDQELNELKAILDYNINSQNNSQFLFSGEDAICLIGKRFIFVVNTKNKTLIYKIVERGSNAAMMNKQFMYCISETDGLRILTHQGIFLINKVATELFKTCFPFSEDSSKKLLNAYKNALEKNASCDKEIREIAENDLLPISIHTLQKSAANLFYLDKNGDKNKEVQMYMLKAAQYGKNFVENENFNYNKFVEICKEIRIINNLRNCLDCPRLITYLEYKQLKPKQLIKYLLNQNNFILAFNISKYLDYEPKKVYQKFVIAKIKTLSNNSTFSEEAKFFEDLMSKIKDIPNISYIKLAKKAFKYGKNEIGVKFLEKEKSILTKIPQYIELKKWDNALELAFDTFDNNVLYTVLDKIFKVESISDFKSIVNKYEKANTIVIEYLKKNAPKELDNYLEKKNKFEDLFFLNLEKFFLSKDITDRYYYISKLKDNLKKIENNYANFPNFDYKFYKTYVSDLENSLVFKKQCLKDNIIQKTDLSSIDNSIYDCYKMAIKKDEGKDGNYGLVEKTNNKYFCLNQKKLSILRIYSYGELKLLPAVKVLLNNNTLKKLCLSPINLAELYVDFKDYDQALEFINQVKERDYFEYKTKILLYMEKYEETLEVYFSEGDFEDNIPKIQDLLKKKPELQGKVKELSVKYKKVL